MIKRRGNVCDWTYVLETGTGNIIARSSWGTNCEFDKATWEQLPIVEGRLAWWWQCVKRWFKHEKRKKTAATKTTPTGQPRRQAPEPVLAKTGAGESRDSSAGAGTAN